MLLTHACKRVDSMHCMHINLWSWKRLQYEFELFSVLPVRTLDVTLDLKDPQCPEQNLGSLELAVTVSPKHGDVRDSVRKPSILFSQTTFSLHLLLIQGNYFFLTLLSTTFEWSHQDKEYYA